MLHTVSAFGGLDSMTQRASYEGRVHGSTSVEASFPGAGLELHHTFRIGPTGCVADLGVGITLGQERQGPQLLRLQCLERFARAADPLAAFGRVGGPILLGWDRLHPIGLVLAVHREWRPKIPLPRPSN